MAISGSLRTTDYALRIGAYAPINGTGSKAFFSGRIDEVSVYNRVLSSNEIAAIYNADSGGKCPVPPSILVQPTNQTVSVGGTATFSVSASGTKPLFYQWSFNGTNITGATNTLLDVDQYPAGSSRHLRRASGQCGRFDQQCQCRADSEHAALHYDAAGQLHQCCWHNRNLHRGCQRFGPIALSVEEKRDESDWGGGHKFHHHQCANQ